MKNKFLEIFKKKNKSKIVCLTAYSKNIAQIIDKHCDIVLIGDSLGSVLYNYKSTRNVTLDIMIEHSKSARIKIKKSLMVVDMPHNTYRNQVMGHLGVLPQSAKNFRYKGKKIIERKKLLKDAKFLEKLGVFAIVLECIESSLTREITQTINIPTIGIGASVNCDGQVLVTDDLIGLNPMNVKFVKKYTNIKKQINSAIIKFKKDVKNKKFPNKKYSY